MSLEQAYEQKCKQCDRLAAENEEIVATVERCYKMLLSEPDTKGALFKAENILRELLADAALAKVKEAGK